MREERDRSQKRGVRGLFDRVAGSARLTPERQRFLIRRGIAALAITLFVIVPGYVASSPGFLGRYANMEAEHETWETSVHARVACHLCHVMPDLGSQAVFNLRMLGEFYIAWLPSRQPDVLDTPGNEACSSCHIDLRAVSPSGDLNIPHRAHVEIVEVDCVECHEFLVHELSPEGRHTPRMIACMRCHDGDQAEDSCSTCHTEKALPDDHRAEDWVVIHADMQEEVDCASCHDWTEDWCVECHTRRPRSHEGKWRSNHRYRVEERRNCEACHEADFCIRCHGEVPELNFDPTLTLIADR